MLYYVSVLFFFMIEEYSVVWICHNLSIHPLMEIGWLPPFVNSAAMNTYVHVFV